MSSPRSSSLQTFTEFERAAWEEKAARYDDSWGTVTSQANERVLDLLALTPGMRMLDCGSGPGHLTQSAAAHGATAIGYDASMKMLTDAKRRYPDRRFVRGDAEQLCFADGSFDAVSSNYLLLHLAYPERSLREAFRVLVPGGRFVYTIWCAPSCSPGLGVVFDAITHHADTSVIPPAPNTFLFSDPSVAQVTLSAIGFTDLSHEVVETAWEVESTTHLFNALQAGTRIGGMIDLQQPERKDRIREAIAIGCDRFRQGQRYRVPMPSLVVSARRPSH